MATTKKRKTETTKPKWGWRRTCFPSGYSRAKRGLIRLLVCPDIALGLKPELKPDLWIARASLPIFSDIADRHITGQQQAECVAEGLVEELLLGAHRAIVREMKLRGVVVPMGEDDDEH